MQVNIDDILVRYNAEVGRLTQRAILAEAQVAQLEARVEELERDTTAEEGA